MLLNTQNALLFTLIGIVSFAAVIDWRKRRIPNLVSLGGALAGLALQTLFHGVDGAGTALAGWAVGFAALLPGYLARQVGAGDVKLMAAAGTFMGPLTTLIAAVASLLVGAALALAVAAFGRGAGPWSRYGNMLRCLLATGRVTYVAPQAGEVMARSLPFGISIAAGCILTQADALQSVVLATAGGL